MYTQTRKHNDNMNNSKAKQNREDIGYDPLFKPDPTTEPASRNNDDQDTKVDDLKKVAKHPSEQTTMAAKHPFEAI